MTTKSTLKSPPPELSPVLQVDESTALRMLNWTDTSANRSKLRAELNHTGPAHSPSYTHASLIHYRNTGTAPTANRSAGLGVDMRR